MRRILSLLCGALMLGQSNAQTPAAGRKSEDVAIVKNAYSGNRGEPELSKGPDALESGGIAGIVSKSGFKLTTSRAAHLTPEEDREYGAWNRMGLANGRLSRIVAAVLRNGEFPIGLLANCNSLLGMLAGLQHSGPDTRPLRVGLVWIDAHADFNTPETTLSGMLGGMPVAVATGLCLTRFRQQSGLDPALPFGYVAMLGIRDADPLEQELIDRHRIEMVPAEALRPPFSGIHAQMKRLSGMTDLIYVHIDMDVLDPGEVSGHPLTVRGGPRSQELAAALEVMFQYRKAAALGIASYPFQSDPGGISLKAACNLVEGCLKGVKASR